MFSFLTRNEKCRNVSAVEKENIQAIFMTLSPRLANLVWHLWLAIIIIIICINASKTWCLFFRFSYLSIAPNIASFSAIRTLRVLRAFKTISALKGLRTMVNSLLRSLKLLSDVLVLFMFSLCVLALIGVQLFSGELRNKCVRTPLPNTSLSFSLYINNASKWYR